MRPSRALAAAALAALAACAGPRPRRAPAAVVRSGLDALEAEGFAPLKGKRVGLLTNATGVDRSGRTTAEALVAGGVDLRALFSPEHGFTLKAENGAAVASGKARVGGREVPLYSLYGNGTVSMRPKPEQLAGLDALVFDVQDVGARYYTYLASMGMALEEAKKAGIEFVVLDRPNPVGGDRVEGPFLDEPGLAGSNPVAYYPVALRHGMTAGEMARLHNAAVGHPRLTVVPLRGWSRSMWFDDTGLPWVPPSPNMPDLDAAALYPAVGAIENTNLSVGRGTPWPFRWFGAPWLDAPAVAERLRAARLPGLTVSVEDRTPTKSVFAGVQCRGVRLKVDDRRAIDPPLTLAHLLVALRDAGGPGFKLDWKESRKLLGRAAVRELYERGAGPDEFLRLFRADAAAFAKARRPYLLYPDVPAGMTLEEKAGQVFMIAADTEIAKAREADVRAGRLGGLLLRWDKFTGPEARAFAEQTQGWARSAPRGLPLLIAADHEGGPVFTQWRFGGTIFPANMALGAAGDPALAEAAARATAVELRALGISVDFAPALDANNNPDNPIIGVRSYGEDPARVSALGLAAIRGYRSGGVLPVVKHFPGHGDTSEDSHLGLPVSTKTLEQLEAVELAPFRAAIAAGAPALMPAHMVFPALGSGREPVSLSTAAMTGFLRGGLGFAGLVFSDSLDMGAVANVRGSSSAAIAAFLAGNDVLLLGKADYPSAFAAFTAAVRDGRIPEARLDESVARIVAAKESLALDAPMPPLETLASPESRALAARAAERSVTLARDPKGVLPLRRGRLALVLVRPAKYADALTAFAADVRRRRPDLEVVEIAQMHPTTATIAGAVLRARGAAAVVVATYASNGPAPAKQRDLVERLAALGAPLVQLSLMNPYDLRGAPPDAAGVCVYGITPASLEAAAKLLFGEIAPRGRLPVTIPGYARAGEGLSRFARRRAAR